jgi:hypothetical protein
MYVCRRNINFLRYLPIAVFVIAWLKTKVYFGNSLRSVGRRFGDMVLKVKLRFVRETRQQHEMRQPINDHSIATM